METRFPISRDRDHVHIAFKWFDAFRPTRALEQSSIHYEKAAILFNLAAVLTQQGLGYDRSTDSGLKDAARKFQVPFSILLPFLTCMSQQGSDHYAADLHTPDLHFANCKNAVIALCTS